MGARQATKLRLNAHTMDANISVDPQATREEIHHRQVDLRYFSRSDGLFEVQGHLVDRKRHAYRRQLATADSPPEVPLHDIIVRLVMDDLLNIHDAQAVMSATPFGVCRDAVHTLKPLIGLRIGSGWNRQVRERLGGAHSCTHIVELLGQMATTALQGQAPQRIARINAPEGEALRRAKVDSCFAYAAHRDVVAQLWPHLYQPKPEAQ